MPIIQKCVWIFIRKYAVQQMSASKWWSFSPCWLLCGIIWTYGHRHWCHEEFLMQFGIPMAGVTTSAVLMLTYNSHHQRKCYWCSESTSLRWVNICADMVRGNGVRPQEGQQQSWLSERWSGAGTKGSRRQSTQRQDETSDRQRQQNTESNGWMSTIVTNQDPPPQSSTGDTINADNNVNILTIN